MVDWRKTYFFIHVKDSSILAGIVHYPILLLFRRVRRIDSWRSYHVVALSLYFKMFKLLLMIVLLVHFFIVRIESFADHRILRLYLLI